MARKIQSKLASRTARLKIPRNDKPIWETVSRTAVGTVRLGYRPTKVGCWVGAVSDGREGYKTWTLKGVVPDDHEDANGSTVLSFDQAVERIRKIARKESGDAGDAPATVADALDAYRNDLCVRDADAGNAGRLRGRLTAALLARPVALLTTTELTGWRDALLAEGLSRGAVTRLCTIMKAALNLIAKRDSRIEKKPWTDALGRLPGSWRPIDRTLPDDAVKQIVTAAYGLSADYGLLVNVLATTGVRLSQAQRITVGDLQDRNNPRVLIPTSRKGRRREAGHTPVPIPVGLAAELSTAARGRIPSAPLLVCDDKAWVTHVAVKLFAKAAAAAGIETTAYSLRHSAITRMLLRGTPIRIVASLHDTSVAMIEKTYGRFIAEFSDATVRSGLLDCTVPAVDGKVVSIGRR
jgi:integrase